VNELIESIFTDFKVDGKSVPVSFLVYNGKATTYVTYQQILADDALGADDNLIAYVDYYDFDIYSKSNYMGIVEAIKSKLTDNGFTWQPIKSSGDFYEADTGYYHKTLNFAIERSI
jgi:hypothetical protein